jgi:hypothetical protein
MTERSLHQHARVSRIHVGQLASTLLTKTARMGLWLR